MANTVKVLGQSKPTATTLTALYTVPASTSTVCSKLIVCNQSAVATSFRVSVAIAGAVDTSAQYLYYDVVIAGNASFECMQGATLATTDIVRVYATLATLSFVLFGAQVT